MWYNPTIGVIRLPQQIELNGKKYPASLFNHQDLLNELEIYPLTYQSLDNRYYLASNESFNLVNDEWIVSYTSTDRPIDEVKFEAVVRAYTDMNFALSSLEDFQKKVDRLQAYGLSAERQTLSDYKRSVVSEYGQRIADIRACTTVGEIETLEQTVVVVADPSEDWREDIEEAIKSALSVVSNAAGMTEYATLADIAAAHSSPANTTQEDFYRQAVTDMNDALALTDNFITRESEYKKVLPAKITGNGGVNAFNFNLADLYKQAKGWREDILQTTVTRFNAIKAGADATAWQAALDDNVFATPTDDAIAQLIDAINNQGTFQTTSDTSEWGAVPVVNSVYQYRLEMIGVVTQELNEFWHNEEANSTMYREAERIRIGNSNGSYMHEQIIGNPKYETWYKNVVAQFSDKMQAIYDASTYEEADTAFATAINYDGPYPADQRPMPITWTDKTVGWTRRTVEATDPYNALVSARAKLVALGLTENEALALASYEGDNKRMLDEWI